MTLRNNIIGRGNIICSALFLIMSAPYAATSRAQSYIECVDSADYYLSHERWLDAERMTIRALRAEPANKSNWLLWSNLGEIRNRIGDYEGAIEAFGIGLSQHPESTPMLNNRASALMQIGRPDEAEADLTESLRIKSDDEWPRLMRGLVRLQTGNIDGAQEDFVTLTDKNPRNADGWSGLARAQAMKGDAETAIESARKSIEIKPDEDVFFFEISLLIETGQLPEASERLRTAMKIFPRRGNLFLLRGWIHKKRNRLEEAEIDKKLAKEYGADPHLIEKIFGSEPVKNH